MLRSSLSDAFSGTRAAHSFLLLLARRACCSAASPTSPSLRLRQLLRSSSRALACSAETQVIPLLVLCPPHRCVRSSPLGAVSPVPLLRLPLSSPPSPPHATIPSPRGRTPHLPQAPTGRTSWMLFATPSPSGASLIRTPAIGSVGVKPSSLRESPLVALAYPSLRSTDINSSPPPVRLLLPSSSPLPSL